MRARLSSLRHVAIAVAGLTFGALLTGGAQAITDTVFRYATPQNGYLNIPNTAFVVTDSSTGYVTGNLGTRPSANVTTCFGSPVNLPHGAIMSEMRVWYRKADTTNFDIQFLRRKSSDGSFVFVTSSSLNDTHAAYAGQVLAIDPAVHTVNNAAFSYVIEVCMNSSSNVLNNIRIAYSYRSAGD